MSAPLDYSKLCTIETYYGFTSLRKHESFIRKYWNESLENNQPQTGKCALPPAPYPEHGSYITNVTRVSNTTGREGYELVTLEVTCQPGYGVLGSNSISCFNGFWPDDFPKCIRMCLLKPHPSVEYRCLVSGEVVGSRACLAHEPPGTLARCPGTPGSTARPRNRIYRSAEEHSSATTSSYQVNHREERRGALALRDLQQDHATVHTDLRRIAHQQQHRHIREARCPGTPGSTARPRNRTYRSAEDRSSATTSSYQKQLPASLFAVAVGKLYRPWNDPTDEAQKSDVIELPYVEVGTCIDNSPPDFLDGGGLAFPTSDRGTQRYYLRGVVSTAPNNENACNTATYTSFTQILKHEDFIKQFLNEL
ncbi:Hemolymph protein 14, partial [Operophtera brumata]